MKAFNLALAFLLELILLAALGYWGFHLRGSNTLHWIVGIGTPLALAIVWSRIAAPMAPTRLKPVPLLAFKITVFTLGSAALYAAGQKHLAIALEIVSLASLTLSFVWKQ